MNNISIHLLSKIKDYLPVTDALNFGSCNWKCFNTLDDKHYWNQANSLIPNNVRLSCVKSYDYDWKKMVLDHNKKNSTCTTFTIPNFLDNPINQIFKSSMVSFGDYTFQCLLKYQSDYLSIYSECSDSYWTNECYTVYQLQNNSKPPLTMCLCQYFDYETNMSGTSQLISLDDLVEQDYINQDDGSITIKITWIMDHFAVYTVNNEFSNHFNFGLVQYPIHNATKYTDLYNFFKINNNVRIWVFNQDSYHSSYTPHLIVQDFQVLYDQLNSRCEILLWGENIQDNKFENNSYNDECFLIFLKVYDPISKIVQYFSHYFYNNRSLFIQDVFKNLQKEFLIRKEGTSYFSNNQWSSLENIVNIESGQIYILSEAACTQDVDQLYKIYKEEQRNQIKALHQQKFPIHLKQVSDVLQNYGFPNWRTVNQYFYHKFNNARELLHYMITNQNMGYCCDSCGYLDFPGNRYKCTICDNFDLCRDCFQQGQTLDYHFESIGNGKWVKIKDGHIHDKSHRVDLYEPIGIIK
jgi:hypothetical protein